MALIWAEGFDSFGTSGGLVGHDDKYTGTNLLSNDTVIAGRLSGFAFQWTNSSGEMITPAITSSDTIIMGFAYKVANFIGTTITIARIYEDSGATGSMAIRALDDGVLNIVRAGNQLAISAPYVITTGQWHYIEVKFVLDNINGSCELRVDGNVVASASGVDTQVGDGLATHAAILGASSTVSRKFDDWYVCDGSGSVNNDFLGPRKIVTIFPDGAGDATEWTPDSGSNFARVNDNPHDDDTSYVETDVVDNEDLYAYDDVADMSSIDGVQINAMARVTIDPFDLKLLSKTGTTTDAGAAQAVSATSYSNFHRILEEDPDTVAAWTQSGVNGAQFGIEAE